MGAESGNKGSVGAVAGPVVEPFASKLGSHGLRLLREETRILQVNTGFLCDRRCRHCHLEAGPGRTEIMSRETMGAVIGFAKRFRFETVDITGGAPEMAPDLPFLIERLSALAPRLILRTNLTALADPARERLLELCIGTRAVLVASFPSTDLAQTDAQRGNGAGEAAVGALRRLNSRGYGVEGSGLELNLVSNPVGAFLPPPQAAVEEEFRRELFRRWGIAFNNLYVFGNAPLGRFRAWLVESGNYGSYLRALADGFNPCAVPGLMCRTQICVSWDGCLYDCDFNIAAGRPYQGRRTLLSELGSLPPPGTPVAVGDYCYACATGSGFT